MVNYSDLEKIIKNLTEDSLDSLIVDINNINDDKKDSNINNNLNDNISNIGEDSSEYFSNKDKKNFDENIVFYVYRVS